MNSVSAPADNVGMRPFDGVRVLDLTHVVAGPFCTYQLALLGAETIKVEEPSVGDMVREDGTDAALNQRGMGTIFLTQNANKRSIALDIKRPTGRDILLALAERADVVVENYRTGALEALGLGYEALATRNPRLIYCSMTAFGQRGPKAPHNAYDQVVQANSGMMFATGTPETAPIKVGAPAVDYSSGMAAAFAIASALFQRERTGVGQRIDCAMLDVALTLLGFHVTGFLHNGIKPRARGNQLAHAASSAYPTRDGLLMLAAYSPRQSRRLWTALDRPDLAKLSALHLQERHRDELAAALSEVLLTKTADEWEQWMNERGIPAARVRSLEEALQMPQISHRGMLHRFERVDDIGTPLTVPVAPFLYQHGGPRVDSPPRTLGADTDEILRELGYSDSDIRELCATGVVKGKA